MEPFQVTVKKSMSVRPSPIINENGPVRIPSYDHPKYTRVENSWERPKWTGSWGYVIARVTNSTEYNPGWALSKAAVDRLIADGWTVSILSKV